MRQFGIRQASRHLTVDEVKALNVTPIVLAEAPGPGRALVAVDIMVSKSAGAMGVGNLPIGSNAPAQYLSSISAGDLRAGVETAFIAGYGLARVGRPADAGDTDFAAIEDAPVIIAAEQDFSAAECSLDLVVTIAEVPVPVE